MSSSARAPDTEGPLRRHDQLAALNRELPNREQNLAYALVGTMRVQLAADDD